MENNDQIDFKKIIHSKTLWFNVGMTLFAIAEALNNDPATFGISDAKFISAVAVFVSVSNIVMRVYTNKPLKGTPGASSLVREKKQNGKNDLQGGRA